MIKFVTTWVTNQIESAETGDDTVNYPYDCPSVRLSRLEI